MSITVKPYNRYDNIHDQVQIGMTSNNILSIRSFGSTGKDYFPYDFTVDLNNLAPNTRYQVCMIKGGQAYSNFDKDLNIIENAFLDKLYFYHQFHDMIEVVLWRTTADEVYILSRYAPVVLTPETLTFTQENRSYSKIVRDTSADPNAFTNYMAEADKQNRFVDFKELASDSDRLYLMDVQIDLVLLLMKTLFDSCTDVRQNITNSGNSSYISLLESCVGDSTCKNMFTFTPSSKCTSILTTGKQRIRNIQANYENKVTPLE